MSNSIWNDERITAYVLDALPAVERSAFEQEMAERPELTRAVEEARQITSALADGWKAEVPGGLSEPARQKLLAEIAHGNDVPRQGPAVQVLRTQSRTGQRLGMRFFAIAATILVLAGISVAVLVLPQRGVQQTAMNQEEMAGEAPYAERGAAPASIELGESVGFEQDFESKPAANQPFSAPADQKADAGYARARGASNEPFSLAAPLPSGDDGAMGYRSSPESVASSGEAPSAASEIASGSLGGSAADATRPAGEFEEAVDPSSWGAYGGGVRNGDEAYMPGNVVAGVEVRLQGQQNVRESEQARGDGLATRLFESPSVEADKGLGPGQSGDQYEPITDNPFKRTVEHPLSTFSIDVDTASFSKVRQYLMEYNQLPRPDAVRIEELVNYFHYGYEPPAAEAEHPFVARMAVATCPWNPAHRLARIAIKGKEMSRGERPPSNLVFLLDVSGSMNQPNKLPLVKRGMQILLEQLNKDDKVSIAVYAGAAGLVLPPTAANQQQVIFDALDRLRAGGSTAGGDGIRLAYATARDSFFEKGNNRVILCTDGDFNVGTTGTDELVRLVEQEAKGGIYLTVLGFGMGNHNDAMLEQVSNRGNGNYAFIDNRAEAEKVLAQQASGTLVTIAKDVKIQVEFNPANVAEYRLIGYENRILAKEDFNDDTKDAGEIGAGHSVTALYELVPSKAEESAIDRPAVDDLKYQRSVALTEAAESQELLTLKLRYKLPESEVSTLIEFPVEDNDQSFAAAGKDFQFAASVAGFGMLLRNSPYKGNWTYSAVREVAGDSVGADEYGFRAEFLRMIDRAAALSGSSK